MVYISDVFHGNFYLVSDLHVPQQMIDHFNRATNSLTENASLELIEMWEFFWMQLLNGIHVNEQFSFEPITFKQFQLFLIITGCQLIAFALIFVCEIIWFHIQHFEFRTVYNRCKNRLIMSARSLVRILDRFKKATFNYITQKIRKLFRK